jgi:uncharacterized protein (DUF433 family)
MGYSNGMSTEDKDYEYLEGPRPGLYRQLWIKRTRIRAEILYYAYIHQDEEDYQTIERLAEDYRLPVEAVRECIDYCTKHLDVILADHAREDRLMEASGMNHPDYKYNPKKYYKILTPEEWSLIIDDEALPG